MKRVFQKGHSYRATIRLGWVKAMAATSQKVADKFAEVGLQVDVRSLGGGQYTATGTWELPTQLVELPDVVETVEEIH